MEPETIKVITEFGIELGVAAVAIISTAIIQSLRHKKKYVAMANLLEIGLRIAKDGVVTKEEAEEFIDEATKVVTLFSVK